MISVITLPSVRQAPALETQRHAKAEGLIHSIVLPFAVFCLTDKQRISNSCLFHIVFRSDQMTRTSAERTSGSYIHGGSPSPDSWSLSKSLGRYVISNVCHVFSSTFVICVCGAEFSQSLQHQLGPFCILLYWIWPGSKGRQRLVVLTMTTIQQVGSLWLWNFMVWGWPPHPVEQLTLVLNGSWHLELKLSIMWPTTTSWIRQCKNRTMSTSRVLEMSQQLEWFVGLSVYLEV